MKNLMRVFENKEFGKLDIMVVNDEPYFPATQCAKILGYNEPEYAVRTHCKGATEMVVSTIGGNQKKKYIREGDLYRLIIRSKLPSAVKFESWVMDEVLPTIRKTGGYVDDETKVVNTYFGDSSSEQQEFVRQVLTEIRTLQSRVKALEPDAEYSKVILHAPDTISTSTIAKDYGMSAQQLNSKLHELKVQYKRGGTWLLYSPYQNKGYASTETYINPRSGHQVIETRWTPGGRQFIYKKLKRHGILPKANGTSIK